MEVMGELKLRRGCTRALPGSKDLVRQRGAACTWFPLPLGGMEDNDGWIRSSVYFVLYA